MKKKNPFPKTVSGLHDRMDKFENEFIEVKTDVKWLKKLQWWELGLIATLGTTSVGIIVTLMLYIF